MNKGKIMKLQIVTKEKIADRQVTFVMYDCTYLIYGVSGINIKSGKRMAIPFGNILRINYETEEGENNEH